MALTDFQRTVCRLLAAQRVELGESYVAGGAALGEATASTRRSRDIDLFHDAKEALAAGWEADRQTLLDAGCTITTLRERPAFVEALVTRGEDRVLIQWATDSAYRFFPLLEHEDFGLVLHPFDLATNKVLAMVGRLEPRDWVDVIAAHERIQHLGYLAWAACGKDPGFSPSGILDHAARSARYVDEEIRGLEFEGPPPSAAELSRTWHAMLAEAREIIASLPTEHAGCCVVDSGGGLYRGSSDDLANWVEAGEVCFRAGSLRGVLPTIRSTKDESGPGPGGPQA